MKFKLQAHIYSHQEQTMLALRHILREARPGSARFNSALGLEEIKAAENAIWLCQTHADLIDNDEAAYPVSLLRQWKAEAEAKALANIGRSRSSQGREGLLDRAYEDALGFLRIGGSPSIALNKYSELTNNEKAILFDKLYQSERGGAPALNPYKAMCQTCSKQVLATEIVFKQYQVRSFREGMQTYTVRVCFECASAERWIDIERQLKYRRFEENERREQEEEVTYW